MNNIFVGNLSFHSTKEDVQKLFEPFGTVAHVVIKERKKGQSRGFGFVDMPNEEEKNKAIAALNNFGFMGRVLVVSKVIPKVEGEFRPKFKPAASPKPWKKPYEGGAPEAKSSDKPRREWKPKYATSERPRKPYGKPAYRRDDREERPRGKGGYQGKSEARPANTPRSGYKKFANPSKPWEKSRPEGSKPPRRDDREERPRTTYPKKDVKPEYSSKSGHSGPAKKFAGNPGAKPPAKPGFKIFYGTKSWPKKGTARS
jgi:RNA recognition motif-containing protein